MQTSRPRRTGRRNKRKGKKRPNFKSLLLFVCLISVCIPSELFPPHPWKKAFWRLKVLIIQRPKQNEFSCCSSSCPNSKAKGPLYTKSGLVTTYVMACQLRRALPRNQKQFISFQSLRKCYSIKKKARLPTNLPSWLKALCKPAAVFQECAEQQAVFNNGKNTHNFAQNSIKVTKVSQQQPS